MVHPKFCFLPQAGFDPPCLARQFRTQGQFGHSARPRKLPAPIRKNPRAFPFCRNSVGLRPLTFDPPRTPGGQSHSSQQSDITRILPAFSGA